MKVFYDGIEQDYHPRESFFYGRFVPCPEGPHRTRAILDAIAGEPGFDIVAPPPRAAGARHGQGEAR